MAPGAEPAKVPGAAPAASGAAPTSLEDLFRDVDDFRRLLLPVGRRQLLTSGVRQRKRSLRLALDKIRG